MSRYDLYGLGNALVDMEFSVDDSFLHDHGITKGHMTLVDAPRIETLLDSLSELSPKRASGAQYPPLLKNGRKHHPFQTGLLQMRR